jgi:hypothetical protein
MSSAISDTSSRALAAYRTNQVANVSPPGAIAAGGSLSGNRGGGMPKISDTVELSDQAYDLLLTPGNYRPNVKAAPVEGEMTKTIISLTA